MGYTRVDPGAASRAAALTVVVAAGLACGVAAANRRAAAVVYASGADLQSINPLIAVHPLAKAVQKHVLFLTLASYDATFNPVDRLATWRWSGARDTLTLELRRDIMWHDGVPTTARDVVFTLEMAQDPRVGYPRRRDLGAVDAVVALDSFTVEMRFAHPQPRFPDVLTDLAILPAHRFGGISPEGIRTAAFNGSPVGNGPFQFVEYRPSQRWVFDRSASFPTDLGVAEVERFVVVVVDEAATKLAALTSQELDFAGISPAHASFVRADPDLQVIDYPVLFSHALVWNLRRAPFDDPRVRRALTHALDRQLIVDAFLYGFGGVAAGPVHPEHPWHEPVETTPFDTAAAGHLLDQAGLVRGPDGVRLRFELFAVEGDAALEQMLQAQLAAVGVEVRIRQLELSSFLARAQAPARDFDALVIGIPGDLSLGYVQAMFEGGDSGPLAYAGYQSARFDTAVRRAQRAATEPELVEAWREAQRVLAHDQPTTWIYHARGLQGATRRIENVDIDLRGELANMVAWRFTRRAARR